MFLKLLSVRYPIFTEPYPKSFITEHNGIFYLVLWSYYTGEIIVQFKERNTHLFWREGEGFISNEKGNMWHVSNVIAFNKWLPPRIWKPLTQLQNKNSGNMVRRRTSVYLLMLMQFWSKNKCSTFQKPQKEKITSLTYLNTFSFALSFWNSTWSQKTVISQKLQRALPSSGKPCEFVMSTIVSIAALQWIQIFGSCELGLRIDLFSSG